MYSFLGHNSMVWYNGNVGEAIGKANSNKKLIVVYIHGAEEVPSSVWENDQIVELCTNECVCLNLQSDSESGKQFSQIYPVLFLPSIFVIGNNGKPIHILPSQNINAEETVEKLKDAVNKNKLQSCAPSSSVSSSPQSTEMKKLPLTEEEKNKKMEEYKEKINERKIQKLLDEQKKQKQNEIDRRKRGQQMQEFKEEQKKKQMLEAAAQKKRDKILEKKAREEVLRKIAQDKAERQSRERKEKEKRAVPTYDDSKATAPVVNTGDIVIQFRLSNGSNLVRTFDVDATLNDVLSNIHSEASKVAGVNFQLLMSYSNRVLSNEDGDKKLNELGISNRSSINVLPGASASIKGWRVGDWCSYLFSYVPGMSSTRVDQPAVTPITSSDQQNQNPSSTSGVRRRNIGRLHDLRNYSDDEDATYNGNSTQQM